MTDKAVKLLSPEAREHLGALAETLQDLTSWAEPDLEASVRALAESRSVKLGRIAQPLRAALTGSTTSPGIFEVMAVLGPAETLARIGDQTGQR